MNFIADIGYDKEDDHYHWLLCQACSNCRLFWRSYKRLGINHGLKEWVVVWIVFLEACLSSNDDRVELKCDTSDLRSKCSKFEKTVVISLLKSVKLILFIGRNV